MQPAVTDLNKHFTADPEKNNPVDLSRNKPGYRIGNGKTAQCIILGKDPKHPADTQSARPHNGGNCGFDRMSQSTQRSRNRIHHGTQLIGTHHNHKALHAPIDNKRIGIIQAQHLASEYQEKSSAQQRKRCGVKQTDKNTADYPFILSAPQILSCKTHGSLIIRSAGNTRHTFKTLTG